jgi:hypothetical protein
MQEVCTHVVFLALHQKSSEHKCELCPMCSAMCSPLFPPKGLKLAFPSGHPENHDSPGLIPQGSLGCWSYIVIQRDRGTGDWY